MTTDILFKESARQKMKAGVDKLADAVKATLGPSGRNVCIRPEQAPHTPFLTKDGVTVAKTINLADKVEDIGAQLVKMAAEKTAIAAGDGTTTSTLLAQVIIREGLKALEANTNPVKIKKGIDKAVAIVVESLRAQSKTITPENMIEVASIAANNERGIGVLVADAITQTGKDGIIHLQPGKTTETTLELTKGIKIDKGYISPYFANNPVKMTAEFENAWILFSERKISNLQDIKHLLEFAMAQKPVRPLLIIAEDVDGAALATMLSTKMGNGAPFCAIKQPGFGNMQIPMFEDIAVMTGGKVMSPMLGHTWEKVDHTWFGKADKITVTDKTTTIIGAKGNKSAIEGRISEIRAIVDNAATVFEKEKQAMRLAKLTNGTAIIHVGGQTDVEVREKMDRIDDAKCATYAAIAEGIVPGGGTAYIRAMSAMPDKFEDSDENIGLGIVLSALIAPFKQIVLNAGMGEDDAHEIIRTISRGSEFYGYNAKTNKCEDLFESGIIDPTKVSRCALENAASVGGLFLTTECSITDYNPIK